MLAPAAQLDFHVNSPVFQVQQFTGEFCIYFAAVTPMYGCVCAYDTTSVLQSIRFEVPNVEIETLCQRACSCPQLRGGPEQRDFTASCLHGAISPTCAFPPISHLQSRKWELGSIDENERNVFETPQKGPVFVPTIRHHQNEPTDPPIWCWHQHQRKMLVCHLCFREGGRFAWPKKDVEQQRPGRRADGCTSTWMCPEGLRRTGPHTRDTWSPRLRGGTGSSSGAPCTCNAPDKMQRGPRTDVAALTLAVAEKLASKKGRAKTIHGLLRDLAVFVRERSDDEDRQSTAEENDVKVLQAMWDDEMEPWDVSLTGDISPTGDQDGNLDMGTLTVETASRGLGLAGKVQVRREMWDRLRPCNWAEAHEGATEQRASRDIKLAAMIQRVHADGRIDRV